MQDLSEKEILNFTENRDSREQCQQQKNQWKRKTNKTFVKAKVETVTRIGRRN
jgi:hypothetical protein